MLATRSLVAEPWLQAHKTLQKKLGALAGHVEWLAWRPEGDALVVATRKAYCWLCLGRLAAGEAAGGWGVERAQRAAKKPVFVGDDPGGAARLLPFDGVGLGLGWLSPRDLLVVCADKEACMQHLPATLALKRYGE